MDVVCFIILASLRISIITVPIAIAVAKISNK